MQKKSCLITLNRITGSPVTQPNREGQAGLFNPGAIAFAVGSCNPSLEPGQGLRGLRMPEGCVYRPNHEGSLTLTSQFPLNGNPYRKSQWPVNNWASALLESELQDGVYQTSLPHSKDENFTKIKAEKINGSLTPCEFDIRPQLGWLHMVEDGMQGGKPVQMKAGRFAALLRSRFFELAVPVRRSQDEGKIAEAQNLVIKFRNMLIALQEGVDDQTCCVYSVQFSEAFENIGIKNYEGLLTCLHVLNGAKEGEVHFDLLPGAFGEAPQTKGWITPVIQSSPLWVWNHPSKLIYEDHGFDKKFNQQKLDELFSLN